MSLANLREVATVAVLAAVIGTVACSQSAPPDEASAAITTPNGSAEEYTNTAAAPDGIGKVYMGREISQVMGHIAASWLERRERVTEERADLVIENLPLQADSVVADIGAGTGYFAYEIAKRVPEGKVLAVDIQPEMLEIIDARRAAGGAQNVEAVLGMEQDPRLPENSVDLVLIVDAYHEFSYPREMGAGIARALKSGGRLVLLEYRGEDPAVAIKPLHKMTEEQAKKELKAVGLEWQRTEDFLPLQHFLVFKKP